MAKVYAPPAGFEAPDFSASFVNGRYDHDLDNKIVADYFARLAAEAKRRVGGTGDLVGKIVRFPVGDGYAQYMVWSHKPLALVHLAIHDAWSIPEAHARGLRLTDIRAMVEGERRMAELFKRKP